MGYPARRPAVPLQQLLPALHAAFDFGVLRSRIPGRGFYRVAEAPKRLLLAWSWTRLAEAV
jgi:hypothetical protein